MSKKKANGPVPVELWGKDHWSTLLYIEVRCVDHFGTPNRDHLRCHTAVHPGLAGRGGDGSRYPTRLNNGNEITEHDDWSCLEDAEAAGLLKWEGSGINPVFRLTDEGWKVVHALRRHLAEGGKIADFRFIAEKIDSFTGNYWFLSNFYDPAPVRYEGEEYPTTEHAYQAAKTLDVRERQQIQETSDPGRTKKLGRRVTLRPDWEDIKLDIMLDLVRQKFRDPTLRRALLDTGTQELVEGNWWGDTFWGVCKGKGSNHLGKILMRVRNEIRNEIRLSGGITRPEEP